MKELSQIGFSFQENQHIFQKLPTLGWWQDSSGSACLASHKALSSNLGTTKKKKLPTTYKLALII
jgi:hypothetical protein